MAINGRAALRPEVSGVERWARELTQRLPALRPDRYVVLGPPPRLAHRAGQVWEQAALPALARRRGARLILSPANLAPLAWPGNVVVVHDAVALSHPEWYSPAYAAWQRLVLPRIVRRAVRVITVSQFSRTELVTHTGADPASIAVIPGGVDDRFRPTADASAARRALGLDGRYVLTVAAGGARKNLATLGRAAAALRELGIAVVAAGGSRGHLDAGPPAAGVRRLGYVPDALLPGLYAGADAFVLPSRHEGFGLTCIEAMASGVPVVAADRAALPETCGGAAVLVDPDDADAVAEALRHVVTDASLRASLVARGVARASVLGWSRAAHDVDAVLAPLLRPAGTVRAQ